MNANQLRDRIMWRIAKTTFVVVVKDGAHYNLIVDPGLGTPWSSKQQRHAEQVATECDGMAMTFEDAFKFLMKHNGGERALDKILHDRIAKKAGITQQKFFKSNSNEIVDANGKPIARPS